jgi:hypothetical protein
MGWAVEGAWRGLRFSSNKKRKSIENSLFAGKSRRRQSMGEPRGQIDTEALAGKGERAGEKKEEA